MESVRFSLVFAQVFLRFAINQSKGLKLGNLAQDRLQQTLAQKSVMEEVVEAVEMMESFQRLVVRLLI